MKLCLGAIVLVATSMTAGFSGAQICNGIQAEETFEYDSRSDNQHLRRKYCEWTVRPVDENHLVRVGVTTFYCWVYQCRSFVAGARTCARYDAAISDCKGTLTVTSNKSVSRGDVLRISSKLYTNSTEDLSSMAKPFREELNMHFMRPGPKRTLLSTGPIKIAERKVFVGLLDYELQVDQLPVVHPGSRDLCPKPTLLSTKHLVPETHTGSRLVSVKQAMLKSDGDCRTVVLFVLPTVQTRSSRGNKLMVSVNCSRINGSLTVVVDDAVSSVACNTVAMQLSWTQQHEPVTVVAEGTGGFTAKLDQLKWIPDGSFHCPKYNPTPQKTWIANLPWLIESSYHEDIFYCLFTISPAPGHDLMVQVHLSFTDNLLERFCRLLSTGQYLQPQLSFIKSAPNSRDSEYQLCDHKMLGGLLMQNKIRVVLGGSLTVDLIATQLHPQLRSQSDFIGSSLGSNEVDAVIVIHQVDSCPSPSHFNSWQLSPDRTQILNTLTVVPGNSQTNCNLHLNSASAVSIANEKQIHKPNTGNPTCWNLRVMLHKFDTTCGLHQLKLTVSNWDSVAASIVHKQKEVCGNGNFTWNVTLLMQAEYDTGMSLWYSGVRSGFVVQFSLTTCDNSTMSVMDKTVELVSNGDDDSLILTLIVLLLALGNICVVLVAFRSPILRMQRGFINCARAAHRLSSSTGDDLVAIDDESCDQM